MERRERRRHDEARDRTSRPPLDPDAVVIAQLRALGTAPIPDAVGEEHLVSMATAVRDGATAPSAPKVVPTLTRAHRRSRMKIAAAFCAGVVLGGTGFAFAGA